MKKLQFIKSESGVEDSINPIELLLDPIRSKILFEIILKKDITAEKLMESTKKSRSTISHHLKRLVESGIVEVYMNPTGKVKYYQLDKKFTDAFYTLDKEKLKESTIEEQSTFIMDLQQMIAIITQIYSNLYSDQIKLLQNKVPFDKVSIDDENEISYYFDGAKHILPYSSSFITGKKEVDFLTKGLNSLIKEFKKKFGDTPETFFNLDSKPLYLVNLHLFPYYEE